MSSSLSGLQLRSKITAGGELELSLATVAIPDPSENEVVIRIEATPINPSDIGLLIGPADPATAKTSGSGDDLRLTASVPQKALPGLAGRIDQAMPVGNEGAGVVIKAGSNPGAQALLGKTVAVIGGEMYAQYRTMKAADCLVLPADATPADGASCFVNPLTALSMVETMRMEGHKALVHTAAASNLGQMLNRICIKDGVPLVNIVRSPEQAALLREQGAKYVVDTSAETFQDDLVNALVETGATIAFDAIGGGKLAGQILSAMEVALVRTATEYSRYGVAVHKQIYLYGMLNTAPTEFPRNFGMFWGMGGWLLFPFLQRLGQERASELRARVTAELKTTFASKYSQVLSLQDVLQADMVVAYTKRATGEKYLINPNKAG